MSGKSEAFSFELVTSCFGSSEYAEFEGHKGLASNMKPFGESTCIFIIPLCMYLFGDQLTLEPFLIHRHFLTVGLNVEATQRPSGSYRDNSALSDQTEATWILFPMYGCPKQKMVTQILLPKSMDMCRIFFDLVTIGLCGTQRQKITFRNK